MVPARWSLPPLSSGELAARIRLAGEVEARAPGAIRAFFERTGRVLGPFDVRAAAGGNGEEALVELLAAPDLPARVDLSDDEACAMISAVQKATLGPAATDYAVAVLEAHLEQPNLIDLLFWPSALAPTEPLDLLLLARTKRGKALAPYLDPMCAPNDLPTPTRTDAAPRARVRAVLVEMAEQGELELTFGEALVSAIVVALPTLDDGAALAALLSDQRGDVPIGEVFASDDVLDTRLAAMKG